MIHIKQGFTQLAEIELNQELNSISFLVFLALWQFGGNWNQKP